MDWNGSVDFLQFIHSILDEMFAKNGLESEKASLIKNCPFGFFSRLAFKKSVKNSTLIVWK